MNEPLLEAREVWFSYNDRCVLQDVSLGLQQGELMALVGPNGSGKSTLIKVLSGLLRPERGAVYLEGEDLKRIPRKRVARRIAVVPQQLATPFGLAARDIVMLGRTPHIRALPGATYRDRLVVEEKMALTDTLQFAERPFGELSGGEQQRVILAMALAQEAEILLLDEPTVHLDINHQMAMLELVRRLNREEGFTVMVVIHDLNLAALYFDRLTLLHRGQILASGCPAQVLDAELLRTVFGDHLLVEKHPVRPVPLVIASPPEDGGDDHRGSDQAVAAKVAFNWPIAR